MAMNLWQDERVEVLTFAISYEGLCGLLIDLDLYVFNPAGELIDCQPIWNGKATVVLSAKEFSEARFMIGPPIREPIRKPIMIDMIRDYQGCEVGFNLASEKGLVRLSPVPEAVWRVWQQSGSLSRGRKAAELFDGFLCW